MKEGMASAYYVTQNLVLHTYVIYIYTYTTYIHNVLACASLQRELLNIEIDFVVFQT